MRRPRFSPFWTLAAALLAIAPAARGQDFSATLEPASPQPADAAPYAEAVLRATGVAGETVQAVRLRAAEGGPWVLYPLTVPPGGTGEARVRLPALSPAQVFAVEALDRYDNGRGDEPPARVLARADAPVAWPADVAAAERIVNPQALAPFAERPAWPAAARQEALIALAAMLVLCGFALVPRRGWLRAAAVVAAVGATGALLAWIRAEAGPAELVVRSFEVHRRDGTAVGAERLTVLAARRTAQGAVDAGTAPYVTYPDRFALRADETVLRPMEPALSGGVPVSFRLEPWQVKLIVSRAGLPPVEAPPAVSVTLDDVNRQVQIRSPGALPASVLVYGGQFLPVEALAAGVARAVPADAERPLRHLRARPEAFGFDGPAMDLFDWWYQGTDFTGQPFFLAWPERAGDAVRLNVVRVTPR